MARKLTDKQRKFIDEYLVDLNATQAAIRSGYSKRTSYAIGAENLTKPEIKREIEKRQEELRNETRITQERLLNELAEIGFSQATDFTTVGGVPLDGSAAYKTTSKLKAIELMARMTGVLDKPKDSGADVEQINQNILSLAELIKNPKPNREIPEDE